MGIKQPGRQGNSLFEISVFRGRLTQKRFYKPNHENNHGLKVVEIDFGFNNTGTTGFDFRSRNRDIHGSDPAVFDLTRR